MSKTDTYYALRFRSSDDLHKKGDIQYGNDDTLYVGQTEECGLKISAHPDYADTCYAVIVKNKDNSGWRMIRQEPKADITVNGVPLGLVCDLSNGDLLKWDQTIVQFTIEDGTSPSAQYVQHKTPWGIWAILGVMLLMIVCVILFLYENNKKPTSVFKHELASICKIEADTLLVLSSQLDTLDVLRADHTSVGTGFITDGGYFVTARHCVEFWLAQENELRPKLRDIKSPIVRRAIDAEMDSTIHLVAILKVTSYDGQHTWKFSSNDFTMDKSRDDIYECGDFENPYLWRSVVSMFEKQDAELGDVAVMKWPYEKGTIHLESPEHIQEAGTILYGFGYPQNENRQTAVFSSNDGKLYQTPESTMSCFLCEKGFDPGFSGGPIFTKESGKSVVGIVSRSDGKHTLIVPVAQINYLIRQIK